MNPRISLILIVVFCLFSSTTIAQVVNQHLKEGDRNYYFFGGVGFGYTGYRMVDENRLFQKIKDSGQFEESGNPSPGMNGHVLGGLLIKEPFVRVTGSYHWDLYNSDETSNDFAKILFFPLYLLSEVENQAAYYMDHDIQFVSINIDKLYWTDEFTKRPYIGLGFSYSFVNDVRSETIRIDVDNREKKLRDRIEYNSSLVSAELIVGTFAARYEPWWIEFRIGYQHMLDQSVDKGTLDPGKEVGDRFNPYYSALYFRIGMGLFL